VSPIDHPVSAKVKTPSSKACIIAEISASVPLPDPSDQGFITKPSSLKAAIKFIFFSTVKVYVAFYDKVWPVIASLHFIKL